MASFIVRVELHNAEREDYKRLDVEMKKRGFLKSITDAEGQWYQLPSGEYFYQGPKTTAYVCEMGVQSAAIIEKRPWIFAAELVTVAFELDPVDDPI